MKVYPLAITSVNWEIYINVCQEVLGFSPTRGLDNQKIDLSDPAAFLATLDFKNQPLDALRYKTEIFDHVGFSFITCMDQKTILEVFTKTKLRCLYKEGKMLYLTVLSGTMAEWLDAIEYGCSDQSSLSMREVMTGCYNHFMTSNLREVFSCFDKIVHVDKTITLRRL